MPDFEQTYHFHPAMRLLRLAIRREWRLKIFFSIVLIAGGAIFAFVFFQKRNILAPFGLATVVLGIKLLWDFLRRPKIEQDKLWNMLNHNRRHIVWVYSVSTQLMPYGMHLWAKGEMYFKLLDGDEITLELPPRKLKMVSKFLNKLLPHATFGYSKEREAQFETNPASLLRPDQS